MSQLKKLFREVLNGIPDEKSIWDRPAKGPEEYIGEGLTRLKDLWDKTAAAGDNKEMPDSAGSITLKQLSRQQIEQNKLLTENYDRFLNCKRVLIADESRSKLDRTVQRAYFGNGGIRFYARILQENAASLDPNYQDAAQMVVSCYNSAIIPMMDQQQIMEEKCRALETEIEAAAKMLADSASLYRALDYTPCGNRLRELKAQVEEGVCGDPQAELRAMKKTLDANGEALQKMLQLSDPMPEPAPLKNAALREELAQLLDAAYLKPLSTAENWTPENYAAAIRELITELETRLLKRYLLPSEMTAKKEER